MERLVRDLRIEQGRVHFAAADSIRGYLTEDFFVEYEPALDLDAMPEHVLTAAYVLNVAPLVWALDQELSVPEMDAALFRSLEAVREYFRKGFPHLGWQGGIHADRLIDAAERERSGATVLFTRGIDSTFSTLAHRADEPVLLHVLRTHGIHADPEVDASCREEIARQADEWRLPHRFVRSNYQTLMKADRVPITDWFARVQHAPGLAGLALPIAWEMGHAGIVVASSHATGFEEGWGSHPDLEGSIRAYGVGVESHGFEQGRQQKTAAIVGAVESGEIPPPRLKVCVNKRNPASNCGSCEKCLRTVTAILAEGHDPTRLGFDAPFEKLVARAGRRLRRPTGDMSLSEPFVRHILLLWHEIRARALEQRAAGRYDELPELHRTFLEELVNTDLVAAERDILAATRDREGRSTPTVVELVGLPGSGKSAAGRALLDAGDSARRAWTPISLHEGFRFTLPRVLLPISLVRYRRTLAPLRPFGDATWPIARAALRFLTKRAQRLRRSRNPIVSTLFLMTVAVTEAALSGWEARLRRRALVVDEGFVHRALGVAVRADPAVRDAVLSAYLETIPAGSACILLRCDAGTARARATARPRGIPKAHRVAAGGGRARDASEATLETLYREQAAVLELPSLRARVRVEEVDANGPLDRTVDQIRAALRRLGIERPLLVFVRE